MKSPFPGMDPYLESHWRDVHTRLMTYIGDQIQEQLPADLVARVEEKIEVDGPDDIRLVAPDVSIVQDQETVIDLPQGEFTLVAEPLVVLEEVPDTSRHVKIVDASSGERVITVIEVLSPTNKLTSSGRNEYQRKQRDYILGGINLVEIDLLRCGQHVLSAALELIPPNRRRMYMMSVRSHLRTKVFGSTLRESLPVIPIPLRRYDRDARLNLQQLVDQVYERGRYWKIDYQSDPPEPPLPPDEAVWVDLLLKSQSRRQ